MTERWEAVMARMVDRVNAPSMFDDPDVLAAIEEEAAAVERGDPKHAAAVAELARRWEAKGWRIVPGDQPGSPPRGMRIEETGG